MPLGARVWQWAELCKCGERGAFSSMNIVLPINSKLIHEGDEFGRGSE